MIISLWIYSSIGNLDALDLKARCTGSMAFRISRNYLFPPLITVAENRMDEISRKDGILI